MAQQPLDSGNQGELENKTFGCIDPLAINYREVQRPYATIPPTITVSSGLWGYNSDGQPTAFLYNQPQDTYILYTVYESDNYPCRYKEEIEGCMDRFATNYDPNATKSCVDCCVYIKEVEPEIPTGETPTPPPSEPTPSEPTIEICSLMGVSTVNYSNTQILVDKNGVDLSKTCCQTLAKDYSLGWVYDDNTQKCYINDDFSNSCLPVLFSLNEKEMSVTCDNPLTINLWLYVGQPKDSNCYNEEQPITAKIKLSNETIDSTLTQVSGYNSQLDGFNNWVRLVAILPATSITLNFNVGVEFDQGLQCCCDYDIFIDNIEVLCNSIIQQSSSRLSGLDCPGFKLTKVIDNKKSWVYNPGLPEVGISDYDIIERADGSFGLLNGEGEINRTFAPSLDADLPWRYTSYWEQSSVLEKHSNLVLNTKQLELTFDMCADCPISGTSLTCPNGYTLSGGTSVCYNITGTTSATSVTTLTYLNLYNLENYKKQFQSFWIPFMEQFIPATTIWSAGERWCNEPCEVINPCDYDFELVDSEVSVEPKPNIRPTLNNTISNINEVPSEFVNLQDELVDTISYAEKPIESPNILSINDIGLTTEKTLFKTIDDLSIINNLEQYRQKFTTVTTEIVQY